MSLENSQTLRNIHKHTYVQQVPCNAVIASSNLDWEMLACV